MLHCPLQQHYAHSSQEEKTLAKIKRERIAIETSLPVGGEKKWKKAIETSLPVWTESGSSRVSNYESRAGEQEIAEGEDASPLFRPPKRTRSAVWEFFGYLKDEDGKVLGMPTCKRCKRKVPCKAANTSNMVHHLREKLPQDHAKIVKSTVRLANIRDGWYKYVQWSLICSP